MPIEGAVLFKLRSIAFSIGLIHPGLRSTIYHVLGEHTDYYTTGAGFLDNGSFMLKKLRISRFFFFFFFYQFMLEFFIKFIIFLH